MDRLKSAIQRSLIQRDRRISRLGHKLLQERIARREEKTLEQKMVDKFKRMGWDDDPIWWRKAKAEGNE